MNISTPGKTPQFMGDVTLVNTPKPQASSTINRKDEAPLSHHIPSKPQTAPDEVVQSPAYLSRAISGVKELSDQLQIIPRECESVFKMPETTSRLLRRSASVTDIQQRRDSVVTESDADSSLGILRLDNEPGYSETEDMGRPSEVLAQLRKGHSQIASQPSYESLFHPEGDQLQMNEKAMKSTSVNGSTQTTPLNNIYSLPTCPNIEADLRLRLQKALAQRTLDRSVDSSVRMSQLSDLINDSMSSTSSDMHTGPPRLELTQGTPQNLKLPANSTFSPEHVGSFGADNFMTSLNQSQNAQDSLCFESFQPAEAAMARMEHDEDSWRQQFEDLPVEVQLQNVSKTDTHSVQHLTHNLELSAFSGIINGDVTVSSSLMEDGRRRISMGEYFGLRTEKLGDVDNMQKNDERPNFGKIIFSPTRSGPHPPLVKISTSQVSPISLDEVPTRDAGLNAEIRSSFQDSFDFSATVEMEDPSPKDDGSPSKSRDLMPPPFAAAPHVKSSHTFSRKTVPSRLSTSLPLCKDSNYYGNNNADISTISMDTGRRESNVTSISHIARLLSEMSGSISTRCLVDNLMKGCVPESLKSSSEEESTSSHLFPVSNVTNEKGKENILNELTSDKNVGEQRVNEWMSSLKNFHQQPIAEDNISLGSDQEQLEPYFEGSSKNVMNIESSSTLPETYNHHSKSISEPLIEGEMVYMPSLVSDIPMMENTFRTQQVQRTHSTPKLHSRIHMTARLKRDSSSDIENQQEGKDVRGVFPRKKDGLLTSSRKILQRSRSMNLQLSEGGESSMTVDKPLLGRLSSSSQDSSAPVKHLEKCSHQHDPIRKLNISQQLQQGPSSSPTESEAYASSLVGSAYSGTKNSSRRTDSTAAGVSPLQVDSTHTQLSWASVQVGSSVTQTFALRNRARQRIRLQVCSTNPAFKLMGERGESLSDLPITLHPEETRRIHVVFTPSHCGPVVGKLIIRRISVVETSASSSAGDRRLIPLFAFGGVAELSIEGASKDRWSQLFLNMCVSDVERQSEVSEADSTSDVQQMITYINVRNTGSVSAFVSLQIASELPFEDCGVDVSPSSLILSPGQCERLCVRFEPDRDVLLWLNSKAEDMQLLANLWLLWSELATWQRIRRVFLRNYSQKDTGPLSSWGCLYSGDFGVANELRDKQSAEAVLAQAVHRIKVAVLVEREKLTMFDLDSTLVFQQLVANETTMLFSPPEAVAATDVVQGRESPLLAGNLHGVSKELSHAEGKPSSTNADRMGRAGYPSSDLIINTILKPHQEDFCFVQFPKTLCNHKSSVKVRFLNPSSESCNVFAQGASHPFMVSTASFTVQANSYFVMRILFKPCEAGVSHSKLNIFVNGRKVRCYQLDGECVSS